MAYNTKPILVDVNGKPIPQYYDALHDEYRPLQGEHGASRAVLYGPDGQPVSTTDGKIDVRASELEALIGEVQESPSANTLLARLKTLADTLGTEATLQAVKIALDSLNTKDYATQATLAEVLSRLEAIERRLDSGEAQVQLKGRTVDRSVVIPRSKYTSNTSTPQPLLEPPNGARGFAAFLRVFGVTGTFAEGQGVSLRARLYLPAGLNWPLVEVRTTPTTRTTAQRMILWYPGIAFGDAGSASPHQCAVVPLVAAGRLEFTILIDGTFEAGQGVDCDLIVEWLI